METAGWRDKNIVAECDSACVQNHQAVIGIEVFTYFNPVAVVTSEIRLNMNILSGFSKD